MATGTDDAMVGDFKKNFADPKNPHKHLQLPMTSKNTFIIVHTQSSVTYTIDGFKNKNEDKVTE